MKASEFKVLKQRNLKVGKNQIYFDGYGYLGNSGEPIFVVEKFEYVQNGIEMFSLIDGFDTFEKAYEVALDPNKYLRSIGLSVS